MRRAIVSLIENVKGIDPLSISAEANSNLLRLRQEIPLDQVELRAVEDGVAGHERLVGRHRPGRRAEATPHGRDGRVQATHRTGGPYERPHTDGAGTHALVIVNNVYLHLMEAARKTGRSQTNGRLAGM